MKNKALFCTNQLTYPKIFSKGRKKTPPTQGFPDEVELIHVWFSWPQRHSWHQFSKDTANCPNIYWGPVLCVPHQQLRWAVPSGSHVICIVVTRDSWPVKGQGTKKAWLEFWTHRWEEDLRYWACGSQYVFEIIDAGAILLLNQDPGKGRLLGPGKELIQNKLPEWFEWKPLLN